MLLWKDCIFCKKKSMGLRMIGFYKFENLEKLDTCRHVVTTKKMEEPYAFSLALHTGEDKDTIINNRKKIADELGWNKDLYFVVANQIHSDQIKVINEEENKGWERLEDAVEACDALVTNKQGVVLSMLTADCVPILLCDTQKKVIAAVHAGWKGTKVEIVAKTIQKMSDCFDCDPQDIIAGIGPAIGSCCYEVDKDVAMHFFDIPRSFERKKDKYMIDLPLINKLQLIHAGLYEENIEMSGICTACEAERFFSYRKEKGCSGRFMSMIGLT